LLVLRIKTELKLTKKGKKALLSYRHAFISWLEK
jgi:hypothetical protein